MDDLDRSRAALIHEYGWRARWWLLTARFWRSLSERLYWASEWARRR